MLRLLVRLAPAGVALALCAPASATVAVPLDFAALTKQADVVVHGIVGEKTSFWAPKKERIYTHTQVTVLRALKGVPSAETLVVRQWGGEVGGVRMDVPGNADLRPGEEVVLFLSADSQFHYVVGLSQGKFTLKADSTGKKVATRDLSGITFARWTPQGKMFLTDRFELSKPLALDALEAHVKRALVPSTALPR